MRFANHVNHKGPIYLTVSPVVVQSGWDSSDIPMHVQALFGPVPDASRWASRLQLSHEPQVEVAGNRCLLLPPGCTE